MEINVVFCNALTAVFGLRELRYTSVRLAICIFMMHIKYTYKGWNFNSDNYLFTTDTK